MKQIQNLQEKTDRFDPLQNILWKVESERDGRTLTKILIASGDWDFKSFLLPFVFLLVFFARKGILMSKLILILIKGKLKGVHYLEVFGMQEFEVIWGH